MRDNGKSYCLHSQLLKSASTWTSFSKLARRSATIISYNLLKLTDLLLSKLTAKWANLLASDGAVMNMSEWMAKASLEMVGESMCDHVTSQAGVLTILSCL